MIDQDTRLNQSDLKAIESRVELEVAAFGDPPTLDSLREEGYTENQRLNAVLDWISGAGRAITLFIAEFIKAFAAIGLAIVLIALEAERIQSGVIALGQHADQAMLIAIAFTVANSVLPIYRLRNVQGHGTLTREGWTMRGKLVAFWRRLTAQPQPYEVDVFDNPTLALTEAAITWATLFLACYAVLSPMLRAYEHEVWYTAIGAVITQSSLNQMIGLVAGLFLAFGGVFGVQSISHEIGVRTLTDKTVRLTDMLVERQRQYDERVATIRKRITDEHKAGKLADERRKAEGQSSLPNTMGEEPSPLSVSGSTASSNGTH